VALLPGSRLGAYEVTAQLGVGGMGEVYRATDTKLKRQVAIKILPSSLAADSDRLARFQREAEVLASLNPLRCQPRPLAKEPPMCPTLSLAWVLASGSTCHRAACERRSNR